MSDNGAALFVVTDRSCALDELAGSFANDVLEHVPGKRVVLRRKAMGLPAMYYAFMQGKPRDWLKMKLSDRVPVEKIELKAVPTDTPYGTVYVYE